MLDEGMGLSWLADKPGNRVNKSPAINKVPVRYSRVFNKGYSLIRVGSSANLFQMNSIQ
jgi:hypothetical protein